MQSLKSRTKTDLALKKIKQQLAAYEQAGAETDRLIAETVQHMITAGKYRRIRTCDMDEPAETECPSGNELSDDEK